MAPLTKQPFSSERGAKTQNATTHTQTKKKLFCRLKLKNELLSNIVINLAPILENNFLNEQLKKYLTDL